MKKVYDFLQGKVFWLLLPLLLSNWLPLVWSRTIGLDMTVIVIWVSFCFSLLIFALGMWWVKAGWKLERPWAMISLALGSLMGMMNYGAALLAVYGYGSEWLAATREWPSWLFMAASAAAYFMAERETSRLKGRPRGN
jgi:hypothetical protein